MRAIDKTFNILEEDEIEEIYYNTIYPTQNNPEEMEEGIIFIDELQRKLEEVNKGENELVRRIMGVYQGNSPLSMSSNGSGNTSDVEIITNFKKEDTHLFSGTEPVPVKKHKYKKITFEEVEQSLQKQNKNLSNELDILITFLKGQTHIYSRANQLFLCKYYWFIVPSILISSGLAIVAPFISADFWNGWFISIMNAVVTILITVCDRFKYQSYSEIYLHMSTQFNKLEVSLEFTRNQICFTEENERVKMILEKMNAIEEKWMWFRESNPILIPVEIQIQNPIISHLNVFSFIKKIEFYKKDLILKYKDIKNEIQYIMYKWNEEENQRFENTFDIRGSTTIIKKNHEKERLSFLLNEKQQVKTELIHYANAYVYIDDLFTREIQHSKFYETWFGGIFFFLGCTNWGFTNWFCAKDAPKKTYENSNPVVDNFLNFIFA